MPAPVIIGALISAGATLASTAITAAAAVGSHSEEAVSAVQKMKNEYGTGASSKIEIANATGSDITLVAQHDFHGHIWEYPIPPRIGAGQTGVFLHVKTAGAAVGSCGAFVFRMKTPEGNDIDVQCGFETPYSGPNKIHVEIAHTLGIWHDGCNWEPTKNHIYNGKLNGRAEGHGSLILGSTGDGTTGLYLFNLGYLR